MRRSERGTTLLEAAVGVSLVASLLAVFIPTYVHGLRGSRMVEATDGLATIGAHAVASAQGKPTHDPFPASVGLTPPAPPRGVPATDDTIMWEQPTWVALDFRPAPAGVAHSYAFSFSSRQEAEQSDFVAQARGDLDGDGVTSTFEIKGTAAGGVAKLEPGMYVEAELE